MKNSVKNINLPSERFLKENFLPRVQLQQEALAITKLINQLNFLRGYDYHCLPVDDNTLPPLLQANFQTIYLQKSMIERIARVTNKNDLTPESRTLYVTKVDGDDVTFSHSPTINDREAQQPQSFTVTLPKELLRLLPEENKNSIQYSYNPTLLREVISKIDHWDLVVLLCSVKHYDGSYKTIRVTAQELEFERLAKEYRLKHVAGEKKEALHNLIKEQASNTTFTKLLNTNNQHEYDEVIIDMMVEQGFANRRLNALINNEQILPNEYEKKNIGKSALLLTLALVTEVAFTYLQFTASYTGWYSLLRIGSVCFTLSFIGASFDLVNNLWGILVDQDAIEMSLKNVNMHMNSSMQRIASVASIANDISFLVGGAGNGLGLLFLLNKYLYNTCPGAFYPIAAVFTVGIALVGREYYLAFNRANLIATLNSFAEYLKEKKTDRDRFYEHNIAIAISALPVIVFRSVGFGGVAVLVALAFHITNGWVNLFIGLGATFITVISVVATRMKVIVDSWSNNKFAYLSPEEKAKAWNEFDYNKIQTTLLSYNTLESIAVALGLLCLTEFNPGVDSCIAAIIGAFIVTIMCRAQILRQINCDALAKLEQAGIDIKERARLTDNAQTTVNPMQAVIADNSYYIELDGEEIKKDDPEYIKKNFALTEEERNNADTKDQTMHKIKTAKLIFEAMKKPYLETNSVFSVLGFSKFIVGVSVMSRGLGFLGYVDICNSILTPLTTIPLNHTLQIIGLALIFAFSNVRNMFKMYSENMSGHIAQKMVEREIYLSTKGTDNSESTCAKYLQFFTQVNPCSSSGLRKTVGELNNYLEKTIREKEEQGSRLNNSTTTINLL